MSLTIISLEWSRRRWVNLHSVHGYRHHHELCVEAHEGFVFGEAMLLHKSLLDGVEEIPVEVRIYQQDEDLGNLIPDVVDVDKTGSGISFDTKLSTQKISRLTRGGNQMCRNPDAKDGNVDGRDDDHCAPFQAGDCTSVFCNQGNPVDDDLHQ